MDDLHIYVAGPMYGGGYLDNNIKAALKVATLITEFGAIPFVPHLYTFWNFIEEQHRDVWLKYDKAWLRKCDGMLRIDGESPGSTLEEKWAGDWDIPVLHLPTVEEIRRQPEVGSRAYTMLYVQTAAWIKALTEPDREGIALAEQP